MQQHVIDNNSGDYQFTDNSPFILESGEQLSSLTLVYETYGQLSGAKDNVILIHHALSTHAHVASHEKNNDNGWWEAMVGANKPIDTNQYFVICINNIGSCFGSSSAISINKKTNKAYQADFPVITFADTVKAQKHLLDYLGIENPHAIIGPSMGGMISLQWFLLYPNSVKNLLLISSCAHAYPANIANRCIQRQVIQLDPAWQQGCYENNPTTGFKIARSIGLVSYRNPDDLNARFAKDALSTHKKISNNAQSSIESYLDYNAEKFVNSFDANCYLTLLQAMDLFDVTEQLKQLPKSETKITIISVDSDKLFLPQQQTDLYQLLKQTQKNVNLIQHSSTYGHDSFLVETDVFGDYIGKAIS